MMIPRTFYGRLNRNMVIVVTEKEILKSGVKIPSKVIFAATIVTRKEIIVETARNPTI